MRNFLIVAATLYFGAASSALATQCNEGTATVNNAQSGQNCTTAEKGMHNSSAGPLTHDGCTAAKANAREKLSVRLTPQCRPYIQTNTPCNVIWMKSCT